MFEVPAGTLSFSVVLYSCVAVVAIVFLLLRRYVSCLGGGELGGKQVPKILTGLFFFALWLFYIVMSILQTYGFISGSF
jgi:solute carrier family 8 (sodium/calcium exchanger)